MFCFEFRPNNSVVKYEYSITILQYPIFSTKLKLITWLRIKTSLSIYIDWCKMHRDPYYLLLAYLINLLQNVHHLFTVGRRIICLGPFVTQRDLWITTGTRINVINGFAVNNCNVIKLVRIQCCGKSSFICFSWVIFWYIYSVDKHCGKQNLVKPIYLILICVYKTTYYLHGFEHTVFSSRFGYTLAFFHCPATPFTYQPYCRTSKICFTISIFTIENM